MWEVCVDDIVKILLCEGEDVELGARNSKYMSVFAFDPLSLTISLILCLASFHIVHSYLYAWIGCVCASLVLSCVEPRELYIAPQLLFRGI